MIRFLSFTSGSCGNCSYLEYEPEDGGRPYGILIDAGISLRRMNAILRSHNLSFASIDAVLITHDHGDHIRNLGSYCKCPFPPLSYERLYCTLPAGFRPGRRE